MIASPDRAHFSSAKAASSAMGVMAVGPNATIGPPPPQTCRSGPVRKHRPSAFSETRQTSVKQKLDNSCHMFDRKRMPGAPWRGGFQDSGE